MDKKDENLSRALFRTPAGQDWMRTALQGKVDEKASERIQTTRASLKAKAIDPLTGKPTNLG